MSQIHFAYDNYKINPRSMCKYPVFDRGYFVDEKGKILSKKQYENKQYKTATFHEVQLLRSDEQKEATEKMKEERDKTAIQKKSYQKTQ